MPRKLNRQAIVLLGVAMLVGVGLAYGVLSPGPASPPDSIQALVEDRGLHGGANRTGGAVDEIEVHGHWTIAIRDQAGHLVSRYEFDNALVQTGAERIRQILARNLTPGLYRIFVSTTNNNECGGVACIIKEPADPTGGPFANLVVSTPNSGPNTGKLVLSGQFTPTTGTSVVAVTTQLGACQPSVAPDSCQDAFGTNLTLKGGLSIPVGANQLVQVTVAIGFA
jgi:hypothetical protein